DEIDVIYCEAHPQVKSSAIFIYDNRPGGLGIADVIWENVDRLLDGAYQLLLDCPCKEGCPACLKIFECRVPSPNEGLDKRGAIELLGRFLKKEGWERVIKFRYDKVDDPERARQIRDEVLRIMRNKLGITIEHPAPLVLSSEEAEKHKADGIWTGDKVIVKEVTEDYMVWLLAHEYTHQWEFGEENIASALCDTKVVPDEKLFSEGFAEWVGFKVLDFYGLGYEMEKFGRHSPHGFSPYSEGFEILKWIEDQDGAHAVVEFIRTGEGYDLRELFERSGMIERIAELQVKRSV
ncbi:hypothetical protein DRP77_10725, partial [Candidatus Poribacteria bacterium]